ncbi:MAG: ABC transporter permease [Bacteroidales bacterium]|nr:ABC transporter permease [Bacteroidales bacterium]
MNTGFFIAKRLTFDKESRETITRPIIKISVLGIALGLAVMIVSVAIVVGFKNEIRKKIAGFGSHIQIINYDSNNSFETLPVSKDQSFYPSLGSVHGIKHIQVFATKPGIIKTQTDIQGAIVKGIGSDFDWSFFRENLKEGEIFSVNDSAKTDAVLISRYLSSLLRLNIDDRFAMYFIDEKPRGRAFKVAGIYETNLEEFDKQFILADIGHIQRLNNWSNDQVSGFEIILDDFRDIDYMTYIVNGIAGAKFYEDGSKLRVINIRQKYPQIFDWLGLIDKNVWIILSLMLIVACFNIISGLLIMILDRTKMIGILKALGTENRTIQRVFLYQAFYLLIRGLFWGNLVGLSLCWIQHYFRILKLEQASYFIDYVPICFNGFYFFLLNLGTLVITFLALQLPSIVISRISPVKTIRFN